MNDDRNTSAVIDGLLRFTISGGVIATVLIMPNMAQVLEAPVRKYFGKLDKRQQEREIKRLLYYMKQRGLIAPTSRGYEHGIVVTRKGRERLKRSDFENLVIHRPATWDKKWRLVFFDIPEESRIARRQLICKLKLLGFIQLQRSVWVHPFPSRSEVELVVSCYKIEKYVSYVEATGIDSESLLRKRFSGLLAPHR